MERIKYNVNYLLDFKINGILVKNIIWNQEFVNILANIINYTLFGKIECNFDTHKIYNDLAKKVVPELIKRKSIDKLDIQELFKIAIASGTSGLDLKGAHSAASLHSHNGIPLNNYLNQPLNDIIEYYYNELINISNSPTSVFHWKKFIEIISSKDNFNLVFFTDDNFETSFDLLFLQKLMEKFSNISVTIIPKNGRYGNDTSYSDIISILSLDIYKKLKTYIKMERISICKNGPRMGAVNLLKLSNEVVDLIEKSDLVLIKGCRAHELTQGGLNKPSFTSMIVLRNITEMETGFDARETPLLFFYLDPGEYAYFGLQKNVIRQKEFPDGKKIMVTFSTLEDHNNRVEMKMDDPQKIIDEVNYLLSNKNQFNNNSTPLLKEANLLAEKLLLITKKTYDKICASYTGARGKEPHNVDKKWFNQLLDYANERVKAGQLGDGQDKITLLDVGTGSERDIKYMTNVLGLKAIGIDISDGFIKKLKELESKGEIPKGSILKADMRDLSIFQDNSFDILRYNASLLHLPVIGKGYMADLALREGYRVLKNNGLIYISVKRGEGLKIIDTKEDLGGRIYQLYTEATLEKLLKRNSFSILKISMEESTRPNEGNLVILIAEKI
ncbi:MAG: methyltransferase domain-containing protein [Candidatus Lokiarchaeota archaeon]|nr:methyltransferase domain-containing protein [Candidatus Lokiarchaeota archaeon]